MTLLSLRRQELEAVDSCYHVWNATSPRKLAVVVDLVSLVNKKPWRDEHVVELTTIVPTKLAVFMLRFNFLPIANGST